ncbi:HIT family protein [Alkalihalobacillus trypoxylicola]|uniref:HIT domain-containing protein n=1 Tax=Alkalihalobacillus trypoxylicola TaxID=519424 RepID=A0A162F3U5_9BACI|nr:DeoR family transcriptional regulator [Alkalihalobacillus trypoxylicola]KYG34434.1 hypothetical protein AZF04_14720 [Alkalihalobacillus trypoxylicola]GAF64665.1 hypothetical protein BTS2_1561 [Bacillus sp. TS-2]
MNKHNEWKNDRILAASKGENPMVMMKMKSGYAVIGDTQFLPGYCVLLPYNKVNSIEDLTMKERADYLVDMTLIGEAILTVCNPKRINYSIYGNTDAFLHAHIFPRYDWEPKERVVHPVWKYPMENWSAERYQYSEEEHGNLKESLKNALIQITHLSY